MESELRGAQERSIRAKRDGRRNPSRAKKKKHVTGKERERADGAGTSYLQQEEVTEITQI